MSYIRVCRARPHDRQRVLVDKFLLEVLSLLRCAQPRARGAARSDDASIFGGVLDHPEAAVMPDRNPRHR